MSATKPILALAVLLAWGLSGAGCNQSGGDRGVAGGRPDVLPAEQRSIEARPGATRKIQESDIYRISSQTLFVQNPARGLAVIDVSDPDRPALRHQLTALTGRGGELFLKGPDLLLVFAEGASAPGRAEVVGVTAAASAPAAGARVLLDGVLVASRLVGDLLYAVTREGEDLQARTWVTSLRVQDPALPVVVARQVVGGYGHEVHVTDRAIYLAEHALTPRFESVTRLRYVDISDPNGAIALRGELDLPGAPQGRFHLDAVGASFRIVTFAGREDGTNLFVIDASDPDRLRVQGQLIGLAKGEDLRATRFVGDRAYVVTFAPQIEKVSGFFFLIDPLWVISLADPAQPRVLGELQVPGWSDYVFPRGDRLLAVGRGGAIGETVAAALFDVSDPTKPRELRRLEFGVPSSATSEANSDFRGVAVIESGALGGEALLAVPYTDNLHDAQGRCAPEHYVQLFDLRPDDLVLRGKVRETGLVRRALPLGGRLYAITDKTVAAIDVSDRGAPRNLASLETGDVAAVESCAEVFVPRPTIVFTGGCALGPGHGAPSSAAGALLLALLGALVLSRRASGAARRPGA
ncbi:MAG: beta-propeller domain-containing protein [Planctomycetota bacterium]